MLAVDAPPLVNVTDADVRPPDATAGAGDLRSTLAVGVLTSVVGVSLLSPSVIVDASAPAPRWAGGGLAPVTTPKSSDSEESTPRDEESSSSVDSGMVGGEMPSFSALVHAFSCSSFLFLAAFSFASSFLFFSAAARRRFASRTSGRRGFET